ncbi:hypothetical protein [Umezawaea beigongshangensis]|uniref:hypothetical protein n=1 Tax=Umezawaea beigongshangensis TaxID=2780383 RepID=UPI0018F22162|nr:hypothetical protein [Umezawaea beigongshangensis]
MGQLSFYSAEARPPDLADLGGLLCASGQVVGFARGRAAKVSVAVEDRWRAVALGAALAERGVDAALSSSEDGALVGTAFRTDLAALAAAWLRGTTKVVPPGFEVNGAVLRLWALAAGRWTDTATGYLLALDPAAPGTHEPLGHALGASGLPVAPVIAPTGGPALRITGRRRLARLAELVGSAPSGACGRTWPAA